MKAITFNSIKNFKAYDYKSSLRIIKNFNDKIFADNSKHLILVAGPNGSGKTTLIANMYKSGNLQLNYLNADLFAISKFNSIEDELKKNISSMYYTMDLVNKYIKNGKSFCYETVMSHPSKIDLIKKAKENGYKITSIFVYTQNPEINIQRVKLRVMQGGHDVSPEKIKSRYYRSLELSKQLESVSDVILRYDNSKNCLIVEDENQKKR